MTAEGVDKLPIQIMAINKQNTFNSSSKSSRMTNISKMMNRSSDINNWIKISIDKKTIGISHMTCFRVA